jgi:uncharacterized protein (DUF2147 family)
MKGIAAAASLALLLLAGSVRGEDGDAVLGLWHTADNRSDVKIYRRGDRYFGQILRLKEPNWPADDKQGMGGKPKTDRYNPDASLRARTIVGIEFMTDFVFAGDHLWKDGKIYDPEAGKTYRCKMTLVSSNRLDVRGFIGVSLIGRTSAWTR